MKRKNDEWKKLLEIFAPSSFEFEEACYLADAIIEAGFRKQIEGEWLSTKNITISARGRRINSTLNACSNCGLSNGRQRRIYCPNCGAKMQRKEDDEK